MSLEKIRKQILLKKRGKLVFSRGKCSVKKCEIPKQVLQYYPERTNKDVFFEGMLNGKNRTFYFECEGGLSDFKIFKPHTFILWPDESYEVIKDGETFLIYVKSRQTYLSDWGEMTEFLTGKKWKRGTYNHNIRMRLVLEDMVEGEKRFTVRNLEIKKRAKNSFGVHYLIFLYRGVEYHGLRGLNKNFNLNERQLKAVEKKFKVELEEVKTKNTDKNKSMLKKVEEDKKNIERVVKTFDIEYVDRDRKADPYKTYVDDEYPRSLMCKTKKELFDFIKKSTDEVDMDNRNNRKYLFEVLDRKWKDKK